MSRSGSKAAGRATRRHWTAEDARSVLEMASNSNLSVAEFARQRHLAPRRLYWWRRRLGHAGLQNGEGQAFEEVVVHRCAPTNAGGRRRFEIVLQDGRKVRVAPSFDANELRRLLAVLGGEDGAC